MKASHTIYYRGFMLDVTGFFYHEPMGDFDTFEVHEVYLDGTDITGLFDDLDNIQRTVLNQHY